jgi:protein phosphatase
MATMTVNGLSHIGHVRKSNEDAMVWDVEIGFAAVADGMGGHHAGEIASHLALETLHGFLRKSATTSDFTWPFGIDPNRSLNANRLMTGIRIANRRVFKRTEDVSEYAVMGTTIVAVLIDEAGVTFASVGDSRIYALAGGMLRQLTVDDSWIVRLAKESNLSEDALKAHPMRNVLTNVVGAKPEIDVDVQEMPWGGETLLLTTDGLHNALPPATMAEILDAMPDALDAAQALVRSALQQDGRDNITAVVVRP